VLLSYIFVKIHKLPLHAAQKTSVIQNSKTLKREFFEPPVIGLRNTGRNNGANFTDSYKRHGLQKKRNKILAFTRSG